jgi:hypothetical protein
MAENLYNNFRQKIFSFHWGWQNYWFKTGAPISLSILRIACFSTLLFVISEAQRDFTKFYDPQDHFFPKGIYLLLNSFPPGEFLNYCTYIGYIFCFFAIVGIFIRPSMMISTVAALLVTTAHYINRGGWDHLWNINLTVAIAFCFAGGTDLLSVKSLYKTAFAKKSFSEIWTESSLYPRWPILLAQFSVGHMFFSAAYSKASRDGFHFGWVFSDNLRIHLATVFYKLDEFTPPPIIDFIMSHEWAWKSASLFNILTQSTAITACFFVRKPVLRMILGSFFLMELFGIYMVMNFKFLFWIPLYCVFIDWEYFLSLIPNKFKGLFSGGISISTINLRWTNIAASMFIFSFISFSMAMTIFKIPFEIGSYPFSNYPMYSEIVVQKPFTKHLPAFLDTDIADLEIKLKNGKVLIPRRDLFQKFTGSTILAKTREEKSYWLNKAVHSFSEKEGIPLNEIDSFSINRVVLMIPPYPAPHRAVVSYRAVAASSDFRSTYTINSRLIKQADKKFLGLSFDIEGLDVESLELGTIRNLKFEPIVGRQNNNVFLFAKSSISERADLALKVIGFGRQSKKYVELLMEAPSIRILGSDVAIRH